MATSPFDPSAFDPDAFDMTPWYVPLSRVGPGGTPLPAAVIEPQLSTEFKIAVIHVVPAPETDVVTVPAEDFDIVVPVSELVTIVVTAEDPTVFVPAE